MKNKLAIAAIILAATCSFAGEFPVGADLSVPYVKNAFIVHPFVQDTLLFVSDSGGGEGARSYRYKAVTEEAVNAVNSLKLNTGFNCSFKNLATTFPSDITFQFNGVSCVELSPF